MGFDCLMDFLVMRNWSSV